MLNTDCHLFKKKKLEKTQLRSDNKSVVKSVGIIQRGNFCHMPMGETQGVSQGDMKC